MNLVVKECGELLKWMEEQRQEAEQYPAKKKKICADMITEYQSVLLKMERFFIRRDIRKYLEMRRARYAVAKGMEEIVPMDMLYFWLIENICDLEAG